MWRETLEIHKKMLVGKAEEKAPRGDKDAGGKYYGLFIIGRCARPASTLNFVQARSLLHSFQQHHHLINSLFKSILNTVSLAAAGSVQSNGELLQTQ